MTGAEPPEVIQGRLGWESGDVSEADPNELEPHPKNREIYGDTESIDDLDPTFKKSVHEKGVLEPLVITEGKQIVSGHRRWLAAKAAGLDTVPVRYCEFDTELAEREALIEFNRQREKTPGQLVNEFEEMLAIEEERAKDRQKEAGAVGGKGGEEFHDPSKGRATELAAEKVNADVSGRTLEKGLKVKEKAEDDDAPGPVRETAQKQWDKLVDGRSSFNAASTAVRRAEKATETPDLPDGEYSVLLADPPWDYDFAETTNRDLANQYATMSVPDLKGLDIPAADDSVLYLWATAPKLPEALAVMRAWGFQYKTGAVWDKQSIGMGYWFRGRHEHLLVGTKGEFSPPEAKHRVASVIESQREEHSAKPDAVYQLIEAAFPGHGKIELFARGTRQGWDTWGDEADG